MSGSTPLYSRVEPYEDNLVTDGLYPRYSGSSLTVFMDNGDIYPDLCYLTLCGSQILPQRPDMALDSVPGIDGIFRGV